jgi:hypothetical protein
LSQASFAKPCHYIGFLKTLPVVFMSSRKRNRQAASSAAVEDGQCTIKLADANLAADLTTLRVFSSCARGLP